MTDTDEARRVAAGLTDDQSLMLGSWEGKVSVPLPVHELNALGLLHVNVLKSAEGAVKRWKSYPTPLGLAVRRILTEQPNTGESA